MHMEQAGIISKLAKQYSTFKTVESEELKPLMLEHFYIIIIGIVCGLFLSLLSFVLEKTIRRQKKVTAINPTIINHI